MFTQTPRVPLWGLTVAVASAGLSSCAAITPEYAEPRAPAEQVAFVETKTVIREGSTIERLLNAGGIGQITAVDGVSTAGLALGRTELLVEPGVRELEVQFRDVIASCDEADAAFEAFFGLQCPRVIHGTTETLDVTLRAGEAYIIVFEVIGSRVFVQVFEKGDGLPVSPALSSQLRYVETV